MKTQWQIYKQLEGLDRTIPRPQVLESTVAARMDRLWQRLVQRLLEKQSYDQQLHHLQACLRLDGSGQTHDKGSKAWDKRWVILNQPIFEWKPATREPKVQRILDQGGQPWWYAYDPRTGQSTYLESEEEVQIWLEERLH